MNCIKFYAFKWGLSFSGFAKLLKRENCFCTNKYRNNDSFEGRNRRYLSSHRAVIVMIICLFKPSKVTLLFLSTIFCVWHHTDMVRSNEKWPNYQEDYFTVIKESFLFNYYVEKCEDRIYFCNFFLIVSYILLNTSVVIVLVYDVCVCLKFFISTLVYKFSHTVTCVLLFYL